MTLQADYSIQIHQNQIQDSGQRSQLWLDLEQIYLPDMKHDEWPFLADGGLQHLAWEAWLKPGYAFARALGMFAALSIWQKNRQSPDRLIKDWSRLILQGNQLSFESLLETLSIPLPWEEASFKRLAYAISAELSL
jgi:oligoendopeptidase F